MRRFAADRPRRRARFHDDDFDAIAPLLCPARLVGCSNLPKVRASRRLTTGALPFSIPAMRFFLLSALLIPAVLFALDDPPGFPVQPGDGMSAAETAAGMKVPEGFSVKVFAAEPDIVQPIAFAIDDRGRLWVCENLSYPDWKPKLFGESCMTEP